MLFCVVFVLIVFCVTHIYVIDYTFCFERGGGRVHGIELHVARWWIDIRYCHLRGKKVAMGLDLILGLLHFSDQLDQN